MAQGVTAQSSKTCEHLLLKALLASWSPTLRLSCLPSRSATQGIDSSHLVFENWF